jgi:two-component system response regulator AtoC
MTAKNTVTNLHILLVDPLAYERPALLVALRDKYEVNVAQTGEEAVHALLECKPDMIIIDADEKNLEILALIEEYDKLIPLLLVGRHPDDEYAGNGFQQSALKMWIEHTISARKLQRQVVNLETDEQDSQTFGNFITHNRRLIQIFAILRRAVETDVPILISGESGTGKELIARGVHELSERKGQPFVAINCAAIPENLLETELFGYEKGAFTGATTTKIGKLEYARDGTVFLDEIGDMPLLTQAKLLRVLQERVFERVGGHQPISFKARLLAATNKNLSEEIRLRTFREDLFYRLNTIHVELPPLRERPEDIPLLMELFLKTLSQRYNKHIVGFSPIVLNTLQKYDWPGNVRELLNTVHHAVLMSDGPRIELKDLPSGFQSGMKATFMLDQLGRVPLDTIVGQAKQALERQIITMALDKFNGNKLRASRYLGIDRKTLYRKMKDLNIRDESEREGERFSARLSSNG